MKKNWLKKFKIRSSVYFIALILLPAFLLVHAMMLYSTDLKKQKYCAELKPDSDIGNIRLEKMASGIPNPLFLTHAGDGSKNLYVVSQNGVITILQEKKILEKPFLNIKKKVRAGGEMGLLGLAFHPEFKKNKRFFVNYTSSRGGLHTVISEFHAASDAMADAQTEKIILKIAQPYPNHNGGDIVFGPDGYLYIGMGDGGAANDPQNRAQNLGELLGKFLRINVNKTEGALPYGIPPDNPFVNVKSARPEIWAYGMRNPWRFSFDRATGKLFAGDVGQDDREEIDIVEGGKNYGWRIMEGIICTPGVNADCDKSGLEPPLMDYGRKDGFCVTGGYVYRGKQMPKLCGVYIYGDYGTGNIWGLRTDGKKITKHKLLIKSSGLNISSFGEDEDGELYVVDLNGVIAKIAAAQ